MGVIDFIMLDLLELENKEFQMSDYLFANPNFEFGIARALDLGATFDSYNESASSGEADAIAIYNDWLMTGKDLQYAIKAAENEKE